MPAEPLGCLCLGWQAQRCQVQLGFSALPLLTPTASSLGLLDPVLSSVPLVSLLEPSASSQNGSGCWGQLAFSL